MATKDVPVACTLTSNDLASQSDRWRALAARALIERVDTADGIRIAFRSDPGVAGELRALVRVENECCAWAEWAVVTGPSQVALDVRSTGEGVTALHGMFRKM